MCAILMGLFLISCLLAHLDSIIYCLSVLFFGSRWEILHSRIWVLALSRDWGSKFGFGFGHKLDADRDLDRPCLDYLAGTSMEDLDICSLNGQVVPLTDQSVVLWLASVLPFLWHLAIRWNSIFILADGFILTILFIAFISLDQITDHLIDQTFATIYDNRAWPRFMVLNLIQFVWLLCRVQRTCN